MTKKHPRVPIGLPIAAVITLILGFVAGPVIRSLATEQQMSTNVLLSAIPFVFVFVSIILFFITFIWLVASILNNNIPERIYRPIEWLVIAGIVLGILGMFQPWSFAAYRYGFMLLFFSTLAFILWSHVVPRGTRPAEEASASIGEFEQSQAAGES
jgi:mannose/fructose/N-acetylgalactosamine-specific phosphotransferase system component IIC